MNGSQTTGRAAPRASAAFIVFVALGVTLALPISALVLFVHAFNLPLLDAIGEAFLNLATTLRDSGAKACTVIIIWNLGSVGLVIVTCIIAARRWRPSRVYCLLAFGLLGISIASWPHIRDVIALAAAWDAPLPWFWYLLRYHPFGLIGLPIGALIAMHPAFPRSDRVWIDRGMCPACRYDLKGKMDAGCPECGWERP